MFCKYSVVLVGWVLLVFGESATFGQNHSKHDAFVWLARDALSGRGNSNCARAGRFEPSGALQLSFYQPAISAEEFLENDRVLDELSATDEQKEKLTVVSAKWNEKRKELNRDPNFNPDKLEAGRIEYWQAVDQILLKHQQTGLAQLQFRHFLRNTGVKRFFLESPQVRKFLNFEKKTCETISQKRQENRAFVREMAVAARIESVETLLAQFNQEKRAVIFEKWPYLTSKDSGLTEKFLIHLQMTDEPEYFKGQKSNIGKNARFPVFRTNAGGEMAPIMNDSDIRSENHLLRLVVFSLLEPSLTSNEEMNRMASEIGFTEEQLQELRAAREEQKAGFDDTFKRSGGAFAKDFQERMKVYDERANENVARILSPLQVQYLDQFVAGKLENKAGPVYDLLNGKLGVALELSGNDKERLKKSAKKAAAKLGRETVEIESELLKRMFEPLLEDQKKMLEDLLGPVPMNIAVGLTIYADKH